MKNKTTQKQILSSKQSEKAIGPEISTLIATREKWHRKKTKGVNHALLQQLLDFYGDTLCVMDITEEFCFKFSKYLLDRVSQNSTRTYLHKLHAVLEYAVSKCIIQHNPMPPIRKLIPGINTPQRTHLSNQELIMLESVPCRHSETKRAFLFACQTGLRLSDIETLQWKDIVDIGGMPTIKKIQVKTGKEVRVPINSKALQLLGPIGQEGPVFDMMSRSVIASDLNQWAEDAGIGKHLTFHVSRHTFATLSIAAGVDIYVVSKLCGHSTVKTTEIYAHMIDKTLQQGVTKLSDAMNEINIKNTKTLKTYVIQGIRIVTSWLFRRRVQKLLLTQ